MDFNVQKRQNLTRLKGRELGRTTMETHLAFFEAMVDLPPFLARVNISCELVSNLLKAMTAPLKRDLRASWCLSIVCRPSDNVSQPYFFEAEKITILIFKIHKINYYVAFMDGIIIVVP